MQPSSAVLSCFFVFFALGVFTLSCVIIFYIVFSSQFLHATSLFYFFSPFLVFKVDLFLLDVSLQWALSAFSPPPISQAGYIGVYPGQVYLTWNFIMSGFFFFLTLDLFAINTTQ